MATVPRRLTFGAHADAYERARPEWPEEAARWFIDTLRIDGQHAGAHQALAELFAARGDVKLATRHRQAAEAAAGRVPAAREKQ